MYKSKNITGSTIACEVIINELIDSSDKNAKSLAMITRGLEYLHRGDKIPLPLRIQLEDIEGVVINASIKTSIENLNSVKKILLTLGLSYIVGYIIGLLFGKSGGGGGSSGGGGGSSKGYTLSQKDKLRQAVIDTYGKSTDNSYSLREVFTVVSKSKSSDLPEHIKKDIVQMGRLCSNNHAMTIDEALVYIQHHNSDLDKLRAELMINHHNRTMSALYYHTEGYGIKLLNSLLVAIKKDIGNSITVYNDISKNYHDTISYYHSLIGKAEMFNVDVKVDTLPNSTLSTFNDFLKKLNISSVKTNLTWGDITASKNQLFTLLQTQSNIMLTETDIQNLFKNSSVRFVQIVNEHGVIAEEIDAVGGIVSKHFNDLKHHEKMLKDAHLMFDEIKGYIANPNPLGISHSNDDASVSGSISNVSHHSINPLDQLTPLHNQVKKMESDIEVITQVFARLAGGHEALFKHLESMGSKGISLNMHIDNVSMWLR